MVTNDFRETERVLNTTKNIFVEKIVNNTLGATRTMAQKTKDERALQRMINAVNNLAKVSLDIPDIHISGSGTTPIAEPSVKITYPNLMNRVFYQGAPIQVVFETKNVKTPYSCYVFANEIGSGKKRIDLFVGQNIRFDKHTIPNILVNIQPNQQLPVGKYDIFLVLYDNNRTSPKRLSDSKGQPVVDNTQNIMGIEIRPPIATGTITPGTPEAKKAEETKGPKGLLGPHTSNPEIHITNKGDFNKVFTGSDKVPLIFEVKGLQKYTASIFLQKDANNVIEIGTDKSNQPIVRLSLPIRDILRGKIPKTQALNLSEYKTLVVILRDENGNPLPGGNKLIDSVNISIAPLQIVPAQNPEIQIINKGDFNKTFVGSEKVPLLFEVKGLSKYTVAIFLQKDANNVINLDTRTYSAARVKMELLIKDIVKKLTTLNFMEYRTLTVLLRDENGKPLPGGNKLLDSVNIDIAHIHIFKPIDGGSIPSTGPIDLEFITNLPTPFGYTVNFPKAGGLVHVKNSNTKNVKTSFMPQHTFVDGPVPTTLKKGNNQKMEFHIYYPAKSNTVVATQTIMVNII